MDLSELLERVDIVDLISQYVDLEERGGEFWGISPFTDPPEKTPSFSVRRETNRFYDFSSGIGGTALTFLKYYFHISTNEAAEKLKVCAGFDGELPPTAQKLDATMVCRRFKAPASREKEGRPQILAPNIMERYEDAPDKLQIWADEGISPAVMRRFGVRYDRFMNRIVYPVRDPDGNIVNIGGRTLDPDWKEKGQRKYNYYYKWPGGLQTIYGLSENRDSILQKREIILFEGAKSVLKAASWGIDNTAAVLTSHLSPEQMRLLIRLGCTAVFALDKEVDIRKDYNIGKLRNYINVFTLRDAAGLLEPKDAPVDRGEDVFRTLYEGRTRYR